MKCPLMSNTVIYACTHVNMHARLALDLKQTEFLIAETKRSDDNILHIKLISPIAALKLWPKTN